ncbi:hypothetical protein GGS23DRAFT_554645 [Durotheca rogersii]|uniref:uncharacterized protein n=1 Tax=Durotheca rogersii TaxID=419775 RepID=UPI00222037CB|nr:uncharacterized protein GGS23DRAFT_554645 [Durotheca rogersii]KAI5865929.1 hypothetical protein GGS23DRAFT_554645 [Durotheca rogersii]
MRRETNLTYLIRAATGLHICLIPFSVRFLFFLGRDGFFVFVSSFLFFFPSLLTLSLLLLQRSDIDYQNPVIRNLPLFFAPFPLPPPRNQFITIPSLDTTNPRAALPSLLQIPLPSQPLNPILPHAGDGRDDITRGFVYICRHNIHLKSMRLCPRVLVDRLHHTGSVPIPNSDFTPIKRREQ